MNAVQTHGTKDANKDNINVAFSLKLNFSKENDHLKRWNELYRVLNINETIDKFLNIDLIDDYFEEFGYDNEMFNSNGWFYDIDQNLFERYIAKDENDPLDLIEIYKGILTGYIPTQKRLDEVVGEDWY